MKDATISLFKEQKKELLFLATIDKHEDYITHLMDKYPNMCDVFESALKYSTEYDKFVSMFTNEYVTSDFISNVKKVFIYILGILNYANDESLIDATMENHEQLAVKYCSFQEVGQHLLSIFHEYDISCKSFASALDNLMDNPDFSSIFTNNEKTQVFFNDVMGAFIYCLELFAITNEKAINK